MNSVPGTTLDFMLDAGYDGGILSLVPTFK